VVGQPRQRIAGRRLRHDTGLAIGRQPRRHRDGGGAGEVERRRGRQLRQHPEPSARQFVVGIRQELDVRRRGLDRQRRGGRPRIQDPVEDAPPAAAPARQPRDLRVQRARGLFHDDGANARQGEVIVRMQVDDEVGGSQRLGRERHDVVAQLLDQQEDDLAGQAGVEVGKR
jgi:hypothetical protein